MLDRAFLNDLHRAGIEDTAIPVDLRDEQGIRTDEILRQLQDTAEALRCALETGVRKDQVVELVKHKLRILLTDNKLSSVAVRNLLEQQQQRKITWPMIVLYCNTKDDLLLLFHELGLQENEWMSGDFLNKHKLSGLPDAIQNSRRFGSWRGFQEYMGKEKPLNERIAACENREDFLRLLEQLGIHADRWKNYTQLTKDGYGSLLCAITRDTRFANWNAFLLFMGEEVKDAYTNRVHRCHTPDDFRTLFTDAGIAEENWKSTGWLKSNGFSGPYMAIKRDPRFGSWKNFLNFMEELSGETWNDRVAACKNQDGFLQIFHSLNLESVWMSSSQLIDRGYPGLYVAIRDDQRFGSWKEFIAFMDPSFLEDKESRKISELNLEEVIAFFLNQTGGAMKLKIYLQFAYPEMSERDIDRIVIHAFKNMYGGRAITKEEEYLRWDDNLPAPTMESGGSDETDEPTVTITGRARDAECVHVCGTWSRRVRVQPDDSFQVTVPLRIGQPNEIRLMSIDRSKKLRSWQKCLMIHQTGEADDVEELFRLLERMSADLAHQISVDPGRREYFAECTERVLIKKFGKSFKEGEEYVKGLLHGRKKGVVRDTITHVLEHFRWIDGMQLPNVQEGSLMFFQKFCATKIRQAKNQGRKGINLCNDPGLGKTRTVWAAVGDERASVFTPNSVVSTWNSEAHACLTDPDLLVLDDASHGRRKRQLRSRKQKHVVTNTQFLQRTEDDDRFRLISGPHDTVIFDEAHSRKNEHSEQSKGAKKVRHRFAINVTATLARNPVELRKMLHTLDPDRLEFHNDAAFRRAFPANDPAALKSLKLIVDQYTIRFRKHEVMEEIDPAQPIAEQLYKLPRKELISPDELGKFEMSERQAQALYELFMDWPAWCRKYGQYIPDDEVNREDGLWTANGLTKMHAYRQVINNPDFINDRSDQDPKAWQMKRIVGKCVRDGRKVVIFCRYEAQAIKYADLLRKHHPASYTGQMSQQGVVMDTSTGQPKRYSVDNEGHYYEDPVGEPMRMLEHERQRFQDDPQSKVLIVTYGAGSVGTTFTAGKATIYDDLPVDCKEDIQAEDRTHRIDPDHQTHTSVEYYQMQARYPRRFIERMKSTWIRRQTDQDGDRISGWEEYDGRGKPKENDEENPWVTAYEAFFGQGTFDQFHSERLQNQRLMFHLINDGIGDESELAKDQSPFFDLENGSGGK